MELEDGFADEEGRPNENMPSLRMVFTFEPTEKGSRFTGITYFPSVEAMQQLVERGMVEGMKPAMGQLDQVLADLASFAADRGTGTQILSDTQVRISRIIRGTAEQVWRAHHEPELMKRWLLAREDGRTATRAGLLRGGGALWRQVFGGRADPSLDESVPKRGLHRPSLLDLGLPPGRQPRGPAAQGVEDCAVGLHSTAIQPPVWNALVRAAPRR
jgi:uncharacterized protein YndB with AHSA1/START domain